MDFFSWLGQLAESLLRFVPRLVIVRATHGGVKWKRGAVVRAMKPGLHVYWPLVTETEIIVTARQTQPLPSQTLTTSDGRRIVIGTVVVYRINDVVKAIGERNWDVESTVKDVTQAAIVEVIAKLSFTEIMSQMAERVLTKRLTSACRAHLRQFGVYVHRCAIIDLADCEVQKLLWDLPPELATAGLLSRSAG